MALQETTKNWSMVVGGLLLIFFALVAVFLPGLTLVSITFIIGVGFLALGVVDVMTYFQQRKHKETSGWILVYALVDIAMSLMLLLHPIVFSSVLPWLVGLFVLVFGVLEIATSVALHHFDAQFWVWTLLSGIVGLVLGAGLLIFPALLVYYLSLFVIVRGISLIVAGLNFNHVI